VVESTRLVDICRLPLGGITRRGDTLHVGALTTMEELAADPTVTERVPLVREALLAGASTQLRNMATIGGNLLQRTRCRDFRDPTVSACNKRAPGSGCAAVTGAARMHAILGASHHCIALHASDLCVPLVALDAVVHLQGVGGRRSVPLTELYLLPGDRPDVENVLEFAVASAAAVLQIEDGRIAMARLALGGVGTVPWRAHAAEELLDGAPANDQTFRAAAQVALRAPFTVPGTAFKVELAKRTIVRALQTVSGVVRS